MNEIITHDGFTARAYDGDELAHGDTVWVQVPGLDVGEWAEIDEDGNPDDPTVALRYWGSDHADTYARVNIKFEMLHSCECGATGPTGWRICHPDA
jgi:hypothetical protein